MPPRRYAATPPRHLAATPPRRHAATPPRRHAGKAMGKKPLDVVLTIFYINKCIQFGVFFGFYFYVIGFVSPFTAGFTRAPLVGSGAESAESAALHMSVPAAAAVAASLDGS